MRQIALDTETPGLSPAKGHRIIEIGCVELLERRPTENRFHVYLQPDRRVPPDATRIHGITDEFLKDKPRFSDIAEAFLAYLRGAELIIHNAPFDVGFLNAELARLGGTPVRTIEDHCTVIDTLEMARRRHPAQRNTLDALCERYGVDNRRRELHGALLDAEILADVYLAMTRSQERLALDAHRIPAKASPRGTSGPSRRLLVRRATEAERIAHEQGLAAIDRASGGRCLWLHGRDPKAH